MRIQSVRIVNFRCLKDVTIAFDDVTTFIGPNGAGKSTVLRALDWFFNAPNKLTEADFNAEMDDQEEKQILVEVTFYDITTQDREQLGPKYAPSDSGIVTIRRTWDGETDQMSGIVHSYPPFDEIRNKPDTASRKAEYSQVMGSLPDADGLANTWQNRDLAEEQMTAWEFAHVELLEETYLPTANSLFSFDGQAVLSGVFDFVFVSADMRAAEESADSGKTILARILEKALDRSKATPKLAQLSEKFASEQRKMTERYLGRQLESLSEALTQKVEDFVIGQTIQLIPHYPELVARKVTFDLKVCDDEAQTTVERQGHGFQRALLVAGLRLLAEQDSQGNDGSTIFLAIEEPELYQHPTQARGFAQVLRNLAGNEQGMQIAYATHSPYFVEPVFFDRVRRVTRETSPETGTHSVRISQASMDKVGERLSPPSEPSPFEKLETLQRRWERVWTDGLSEALFADVVVLVEGTTDKAILDGLSARMGGHSFAQSGVCIADVGGKPSFFTPHAILTELGIPVIVAFDGDSGLELRMRQDSSRPENQIQSELRNNIQENHRLERYFGCPEEDHPSGWLLRDQLFAWQDTLETQLAADWPEFGPKMEELINQGRCIGNKHAASYRIAAMEVETPPRGDLLAFVEAIRSVSPRSRQ